MNQFLKSLALESSEVHHGQDYHDDDEQGASIDVTVGDMIEEQMLEGDKASEMLNHAHDAREVANDLQELADRAEKIADMDERYAHVAVESLQREYATIAKVAKLDYTPTSFESTLIPVPRSKALAADARRAADHLLANANAMDTFSSEGAIADLFNNKDKAIRKAGFALEYQIKKAKNASKYIQEHGMLFAHKGIKEFLSVDKKELKDVGGALKDDAAYAHSVKAYIDERLNYLSSLKAGDAVKQGDEKAVNGALLMGNWKVENFRRIHQGSFWSSFGKAPIVGAIGSYIGGMELRNAAILLSNPSGNAAVLSAAKGITVTAGNVVAGGLISFALGSTILKLTRDYVVNKSDVIGQISLEDFLSAFGKVAELEELSDTKATYARIEEIEKHLKTLKGDDKATYKDAMAELSKVKKFLDIMKTHIWFLMTQSVRILSAISKHA